MDPQTKARIEFEAAQFKARQGTSQQQDYSSVEDGLRPYVFAHAAFALLDKAIAENVACLHSEGVPVTYKRKDVAIVVSLGLRRAVFGFRLIDNKVGIAFFTDSPYPDGQARSEFWSPWPAEVQPLQDLVQPIKIFMEDMRAFLMNGTRPA